MEINESKFLKEYPNILSVLLFDNTTKKNITWSTDNYKGYGPGYYERLRFGNEKLVSVKNKDVDTPILTYNSLNNLITITFTANIDNIKQIIRYFQYRNICIYKFYFLYLLI